VVCSGKSNSEKPFALDILHRLAFRGKDKYDSELCGDHKGNPSPIWVVDLEEYQVVTIFDIQNGKRREFLNNLRQSATKYEVLWDSNGLELNQS
jgi:CRISPR-associated protein Cmr6